MRSFRIIILGTVTTSEHTHQSWGKTIPSSTWSRMVTGGSSIKSRSEGKSRTDDVAARKIPLSDLHRPQVARQPLINEGRNTDARFPCTAGLHPRTTSRRSNGRDEYYRVRGSTPEDGLYPFLTGETGKNGEKLHAQGGHRDLGGERPRDRSIQDEREEGDRDSEEEEEEHHLKEDSEEAGKD